MFDAVRIHFVQELKSVSSFTIFGLPNKTIPHPERPCNMSPSFSSEATVKAQPVDLERGDSTLGPSSHPPGTHTYSRVSEMSASCTDSSACGKPDQNPSQASIALRASRGCMSAFCGTDKRFKYSLCCGTTVVVAASLSCGLSFGLRHTLNKDPSAAQMRCGAGSEWTNTTEAVAISHFSSPGAVACSSNDLGYHLGDGNYGDKVWDDQTIVFVTEGVEGVRLAPGWGVEWKVVDPATKLPVLARVDDKGQVTWTDMD